VESPLINLVVNLPVAQVASRPDNLLANPLILRLVYHRGSHLASQLHLLGNRLVNLRDNPLKSRPDSRLDSLLASLLRHLDNLVDNQVKNLLLSQLNSQVESPLVSRLASRQEHLLLFHLVILLANQLASRLDSQVKSLQHNRLENQVGCHRENLPAHPWNNPLESLPASPLLFLANSPMSLQGNPLRNLLDSPL
jgi:hypothetical protein